MDKRQFRILATSDLHSYVFPYHYSDTIEKNMGLAKIASLIASLRDENTLVIDNGDTLQGSPLSFYHYHQDSQAIHPMTLAMKQVGYDYLNVGNHDFNYGTEELEKHLAALQVPCLTSNILIEGKPLGPHYLLRTLPNGLTLALIGVCTQYIPHWETPDHIKGCEFLDAYETLKANVKKAKEEAHPDFIIGVYHGGLERDPKTGEPTENLTGENEGYKMACGIEGLDLLISGHQHRTLVEKIGQVWVTQTPCNGQGLAALTITQENQGWDVQASIREPEGPASQEVLAPLLEVEKATQSWLDQPLGTTTEDLVVHDGLDARIHKHPIVSYLNQVQFNLTHADLAASALFNDATGFKKQVTMRDLVSTYVYPNTTVVKAIDGKTLKEYLEKCASFFIVQEGTIQVNPKYVTPKPQYYNYDMVDGITYKMKLSNPEGSRITLLEKDGKAIQDDDCFTISLNNYRASGGGNFDMIASCKTVQEFQQDMVEVLAEYIADHPSIDPHHIDNITIEI